MVVPSAAQLQAFAGGQMTDLPEYPGNYDATALMEIVSPGNEAEGINYAITMEAFIAFMQQGLLPIAASDVSVVPSGTITVTNAQSALEELDTKKAAIADLASVAFSGSGSDIDSGNMGLTSLVVTGGTLANGAQALSLTATQPASPVATQSAVLITVTGAGSAAQTNNAYRIVYAAGYTGSSQNTALTAVNQNAGTGSVLIGAAGGNGVIGNIGGIFNSSATTSGLNVGVDCIAGNGDVNVGVVGIAQIAKNSATNIGGAFSAVNTGTSPVQVGLWASLNQTTVPTVSAAAIFDNGSQIDPVARFRVAGVDKVLVGADGKVNIGNDVAADSLLTINANTAAGPAPINGTVLHIVGDGTTVSRIQMDTAGGNPVFNAIGGRTSGGTNGTPSATPALSTLLSIGGQGYTTAPTTAYNVRIAMVAKTLWAAGNADTYMGFFTTPTSSVTPAEAMRIQSSGGVSIGDAAIASDPGIGNLYVSNAIRSGSFTVATLPAGVTGDRVYCSNCRVFNGAGTQEGAAAGTGGPVFYNGSAWKIAGTNITAVA